MQNTILVQYSVLICRLWFVIFMITLFQQAGYVIFIHQHWGLCKYYLYYLSCQVININFLQRLKVIGVSYLMGIFIVCLYPILYKQCHFQYSFKISKCMGKCYQISSYISEETCKFLEFNFCEIENTFFENIYIN